jgi:methylglutaconyl-CoA hydratase
MSHIELKSEGALVNLTLKRAEVHNAFNAELIAELIDALDEVARSRTARVLVLQAEGASFSAGADLNWMRAMAAASEEENFGDALKLAELMRRLRFLPQATIARVQGSAFGGGVGLIACTDIAIGVSTAKFGLTESKLGLAPAVISPYVIDAIGARHAQQLFLTAEMFDAQKAHRLGLLHEVVQREELDQAIQGQVARLLTAGPEAVSASKQLIAQVSGRTVEAQHALDQNTARLIARLRVSPEGQEGIAAFLEKRAPDFALK